MQRQQRQSLADTILVWGFVLFLAGLFGAGGFEAWKILSVIPAAFESASDMRSPVWPSQQDDRPNQSGRRPSAQQRARDYERARQQDR